MSTGLPGNRLNILSKRDYVDATIANGASESAVIDLGGAALCAVYVPSGVEGDTIGVFASVDNSTFDHVYDTSGTEIKATKPSAGWVSLSPSDFSGLQYIKIQTRTGAAAQAQTGAAAIVVAVSGDAL